MSNPPPSQPDPTRAAIEAIQGYLAETTRTLAVQAENITEAVGFTHDLAEHMRETRQSLGELHDKFDRLEALVGNFVRETTKLRSEVREKLKVAGG